MDLSPQKPCAHIFQGVVFDGLISQRMANKHLRPKRWIRSGSAFRMGFPDMQDFPGGKIVGIGGNTTQERSPTR